MENKAQRDGEEKYEYEGGSFLTSGLNAVRFFFVAGICAAINIVRHSFVLLIVALAD